MYLWLYQVTSLLTLLHYVNGCTAQQAPLLADTLYEPFSPSFSKFVEDRLKEWHTPGTAIAVIKGNKTWTKGYGYANLDTKEEVTPFTLFQGGSTTKAFTAALAALLVEDQEIHRDIAWTTKLHDLIPEDFVLTDEYATKETTFEDAMCHRTGLPRHDFSWINTNASIADVVRAMRHFPFTAPFRTKWQYNNLMFETVAHIVQVLTKQPLNQTYFDWLFKPLGMVETYTSMHEADECQRTNPKCKLARQYDFSNKTSTVNEIPLDVLPPFIGAGGIISNVNDYAKWVRALMTETGPLSKSSHDALRRPRIPASFSEPDYPLAPFDDTSWYGLGLMGATYRGYKVHYHDGAIGGFLTRLMFFPSLDFGFVIFQNAPNFAFHAVGWRLVDDFLGVPADERVDMNSRIWSDYLNHISDVNGQPAKLYPDVSTPPILPALPPADYAGTYTHPGYGNITLKLIEADDYNTNPLRLLKPTNFVLEHTPKLLQQHYRLHHVSGENWLVEQKDFVFVDKDLPSGYTKARTVVGPDGKVESLYMVVETEVKTEDGWAKFVRVS